MLEPIVLSGPLDQYAAEPLKEQSLALLEADGDAVFDFSKVDRMHAASLQVLVALQKDLGHTGRNVVLLSVENNVRELFRISGTDDFFQFPDGAR
jgi:anti-anti-sigma factor